jgi:hypothetical protein
MPLDEARPVDLSHYRDRGDFDYRWLQLVGRVQAHPALA